MADSHPSTQRAPRSAMIDVARGLLLVAMASYHLSWDLANVRLVGWGVSTDPAWRAYAAAIAGGFLLLSGISFRLACRNGLDGGRYLARLARLGLAAAAVSAATYVVFPDSFVFFGILHMMLLASVVAPLLIRLPVPLLLLMAAIALVLPALWRSPALDGMVLGFLGLGATPPVSNDLVPVFPWIAPYLLGLVIGGPLAHRAAEAMPPRRGSGGLIFIGRHSLAFYLIHQPLLYGLAVGLAALLPVDPAVQRSSFVADCQTECSSTADAALCERFCGCVASSIDDTGVWNTRTPEARFTPLIATAVQACSAPDALAPDGTDDN